MADSDSYQQHEHRDAQVYVDQHGREWAVVLDAKSFAPCVAPIPLGWTAPIYPPAARLTVPRKADGKPRLGFLEIDYATWERDHRAAHREHRRRLTQAATSMYGQGASAALAHPPAELLDFVGTPPQPVELILLARTGRAQWVLGTPGYPVPAAARALLEQWRRAEETTTAVAVDETDDALLLAQYGDADAEDDDAPGTPALDPAGAAVLAALGDGDVSDDDDDPDGLLALAGAGAGAPAAKVTTTPTRKVRA